MRRTLAVGLGVLVAAAALVPLAITWIERQQARRTGGMALVGAPAQAGPGRVAVVYFSRSGNTALAARHVAQRLSATLHLLEAPQYALGVAGLARSAIDANALRNNPADLPEITPRTIDLTPYDSVWLGSPVWFYSPAPPLWAFVEHNRFDGQHVVLFNTFNSHFGDDRIAAFKARVMMRGARSFEHRHVNRGRMTRQLTPEQMLQAIDEAWFGSQSGS